MIFPPSIFFREKPGLKRYIFSRRKKEKISLSLIFFPLSPFFSLIDFLGAGMMGGGRDVKLWFVGREKKKRGGNLGPNPRAHTRMSL